MKTTSLRSLTSSSTEEASSPDAALAKAAEFCIETSRIQAWESFDDARAGRDPLRDELISGPPPTRWKILGAPEEVAGADGAHRVHVLRNGEETWVYCIDRLHAEWFVESASRSSEAGYR